MKSKGEEVEEKEERVQPEQTAQQWTSTWFACEWPSLAPSPPTNIFLKRQGSSLLSDLNLRSYYMRTSTSVKIAIYKGLPRLSVSSARPNLDGEMGCRCRRGMSWNMKALECQVLTFFLASFLSNLGIFPVCRGCHTATDNSVIFFCGEKIMRLGRNFS